MVQVMLPARPRLKGDALHGGAAVLLVLKLLLPLAP
jgi:hypothetical protein